MVCQNYDSHNLDSEMCEEEKECYNCRYLGTTLCYFKDYNLRVFFAAILEYLEMDGEDKDY